MSDKICRLKYHVKNMSNLIISSNVGDPNMTSTCGFIPGSVVLGALAWRYIRKQNLIPEAAHEDNDFYQLFLSGNVRFIPAYLLEEGKYGAAEFLPSPLCLQSEKGNEDEIVNLFENEQNVKTKHIGKFCFIERKSLYIDSPSTRTNFHHQRDRLKGRSRESILFNYESMEPGHIFHGEIIGYEKDLVNLWSALNDEFQIRIGRSRNTQYGNCDFSFQGSVEEYSPKAKTVEKTFTITLISPCILYNNSGFPDSTTENFEQHLVKFLGVESNDIIVTKYFSRTDEVENFISVWRLRRPSESALSAGSSFQVKITGNLTDELTTKILSLEETGIGERKEEGYGSLSIDWFKEEKYGKKQLEKKSACIPSAQPPEKVKEIFGNILRTRLITEIETKAAEDARHFGKSDIPPRSLLNRLSSMAKISGIRADDLKSLKSTANDHLKRCRYKGTDLQSFLDKKDEDILSDIDVLDNISNKPKEILGSIMTNILKDPTFRKELKIRFLTTFLNCLCKISKRNEREKDENASKEGKQ